jgi:uncharacterized protein YciI
VSLGVAIPGVAVEGGAVVDGSAAVVAPVESRVEPFVESLATRESDTVQPAMHPAANRIQRRDIKCIARAVEVDGIRRPLHVRCPAWHHSVMYALAIIRYRRPLEEVLLVTEQHRAYLRSLKDAGTLVASGPMDPRTGGALLLRVPDDDVPGSLDAVRDGDPYVTFGVAQYELIPWAVNTGKQGLDSI